MARSTHTQRTHIVATIGPASSSVKTLVRMIKAGMTVARLNFSHGTHEQHEKLVASVRTAARRVGVPVAILQDLSGPKLRVGELPKEGVRLVRGKTVLFRVHGEFADDASGLVIPIPERHFARFVQRGTRLLLDDGAMEVRVVSKGANWVKARVMRGGTLISHKGVNIPEAAIPRSPITAKDREDLLFGLRMGVDMVAMSFVQSADDVRRLRRLIARYEKQHRLRSVDEAPVRVFAKIEKPQAVEAMDEIIDEADGVLVARGDLALEVGYERVPLIQKALIERCLLVGKPSIVATQLLHTMVDSPRPTRAEVSDVANAVIDHADAVMLSQESAVGAFPVKAVQQLQDVIRETEASAYDDVAGVHVDDVDGEEAGASSSFVRSVAHLVRTTPVDAIVTYSLEEEMELVSLLSSMRLEVPLFSVVEDDRVARQQALLWGVTPVTFSGDWSGSLEGVSARILNALRRRSLLKKRGTVLVVSEQRERRGRRWSSEYRLQMLSA